MTVRGFVEREYQKSCAEATVRRVPGVIGVNNEIVFPVVEEPNQRTMPSPLPARNLAGQTLALRLPP